jgi:UDP-N-acetylmuramate dehydrogenase
MGLGGTQKNWLTSVFGERVKFDEPMSRHTSLRVGGPAEALVSPPGLDPLVKLLRWIEENRLPWQVIGDGTNLLVRDGGVRGVVIALADGFDRIRRIGTGDDGVRVAAMAGARMSALCRYAIREELAGMNFAVGIPGTVGGGIRMNAGTAGEWVSDALRTVTTLLPDGTLIDVSRAEIELGYRGISWENGLGTAHPERRIIIDATFSLTPADPEILRQDAKRRLDKRRRRQPARLPSAGCFFKNPPDGLAAGKLIEAAGLKERRIGGAQISSRHANFIVNRGGATAIDILALMDLVTETVRHRFDVELEAEVQIIGT